MKPTELQIGDYALAKPSMMLIKVAAVHHKKVGYHAVTHKLNWVRIGLLEPIPLTAEILKRNFEKYNENYIFSDDFFCFETHEYNDGMWMLSYEINEMSLPNTQIANICYVHELQHALRLCGLNELADNFKVEE